MCGAGRCSRFVKSTCVIFIITMMQIDDLEHDIGQMGLGFGEVPVGFNPFPGGEDFIGPLGADAQPFGGLVQAGVNAAGRIFFRAARDEAFRRGREGLRRTVIPAVARAFDFGREPRVTGGGVDAAPAEVAISAPVRDSGRFRLRGAVKGVERVSPGGQPGGHVKLQFGVPGPSLGRQQDSGFGLGFRVSRIITFSFSCKYK